MKDIFLLDMDDTLLDFPRSEEENFFRTLSFFGICAGRDAYLRFHKINDDLWKLLERGSVTRECLKIRRFEILFEEYGFEGDLGAIARTYCENLRDVCFPFEGAEAFVGTLSEHGRVYLVTNGSEQIQKRHMADAGFLPHLSGAFISEDIGCNKPSAAFAEHVKTHIPDFRNARAVWIGDSLTSDMLCAEAAGIDFILYAPAGKPHGFSGAHAENYEEILTLLGIC